MPAVTAADKAASTTRILGPPDAQLAAWEDRAEEGIRRALVQVMDQVADRIGKSLTAVLVAHLPGKHDQSTHGKGGRDGRETALTTAESSPLRARKNLGGGSQGKTTWEHHDKGTIVRKEFKEGTESKAHVDSEVLASGVAEAVGVQAPVVVGLDRRTVIMENVPGQTWAERGGLSTLTQDRISSDEGRLLGLHDVLIGNLDRSPGNFMVNDKGSLVAIDHGYGFQASPMAGFSSPFAGHFTNGTWGFADKIDISPRDLSVIRDRLTGLRGDFEARGRGRWHDEMMDRLGRLEKIATGTRDRL